MKVRAPITRRLDPLLKPLRIDQSWHLYGRGERKLKRFEIEVDGEVVFRSNDPERQWLQPVIEFRRTRQIYTRMCADGGGGKQAYFGWIAARAQKDFPGTTEVLARCTAAPWIGDGDVDDVQVLKEFRLRAPGWKLEEGR